MAISMALTEDADEFVVAWLVLQNRAPSGSWSEISAVNVRSSGGVEPGRAGASLRHVLACTVFEDRCGA